MSLNDLDPSHYTVLGVSVDASISEIKAAFHASALRFHPDKCNSLNDQNIEFYKIKYDRIQRAWLILQDDSSRSVYDSALQAYENKRDVAHYIVSVDDLDVHDVIEEDDSYIYSYGCRCGAKVLIEGTELEEGRELFTCEMCPLTYKINIFGEEGSDLEMEEI